MKKHRSKRMGSLLLGIFSLTIFLFLWNCQQEEGFVEQEQLAIKSIPFSHLPSNLMNDVKQLNNTIIMDRSDTDEFLIVDENQIISLIDSLNTTRYSIKFSFNDQPENVLYNLILGIDSAGNPTVPFVLKYTVKNMEEIKEDTYLDFSKMIGTIEDYSYERFLQYAQNYFNTAGRNTSQPCNMYEGGGGEFENPDEEGGNDGTNDSDNYADCSILLWSNGTTGEIIGVSWSCSDGTSGNTSRTEECDGGTQSDSIGSAGVNQGNTSDNSCPGIKIRDHKDVCVCPDGFFEDKGICVEEPCIGDPLPNIKVAAQTNSGTKGGMYGKTRSQNTKWHRGLDLKSSFGDPIFAIYDGTARKVTQRKNGNVVGAGHYVEVTSTVDGKTVKILYFHMQENNRETGTVKAGGIIGYQGDSGNLREAIDEGYAISHLHIKAKENGAVVDPISHLKTTIDSDTGAVTNNPC